VPGQFVKAKICEHTHKTTTDRVTENCEGPLKLEASENKSEDRRTPRTFFFSSGSSEQGFKNTTSIVFVCQPKCHPFLRDLAVGRKSRAGKITRLQKDATNVGIVILATVQEKGRTKSARKEDRHLIFVLKEEPFLPPPLPNTRTEELARSPRSGSERTNRGGRRRRRQWK
jgi:hypothetical protein